MPKQVDVDDYSPSGSWDLIACPGKLTSMDKDGQNNISMITYTITIRWVVGGLNGWLVDE